MLKPGDKLGHVYFEGEYGENALQGSKYAPRSKGLTLVEQKIKATDTDLSRPRSPRSSARASRRS